MKKVFIVCCLFLLNLFSIFAAYNGPLYWETDTIMFCKAEKINVVNNRYVTFTFINDKGEKEHRLKDLYTQKEVILLWACYVPSFELDQDYCVYVGSRFGGFFLTPDLSERALTEFRCGDACPFYKGTTIVQSAEIFMIKADGTIIRDDIAFANDEFKEGLIYVMLKDGSCGFLDETGEMVVRVPDQFKHVVEGREFYFQNGVAVLSHGVIGSNDDYECIVVNHDGVIIGRTNCMLYPFTEGVAQFCFFEDHEKNKKYMKYGYMDKYCNILIPPIFDKERWEYIPDFKDGFTEVKLKGKTFKMDGSGNIYSKETGKRVCNASSLKPEDVSDRKIDGDKKPGGFTNPLKFLKKQ